MRPACFVILLTVSVAPACLAPLSVAQAEAYAGPFLNWSSRPKARLAQPAPQTPAGQEKTAQTPAVPTSPPQGFYGASTNRAPTPALPPAVAPTPADAATPAAYRPIAFRTGGARFYSLHRAFGVEPDPIVPSAAGPTVVKPAKP